MVFGYNAPFSFLQIFWCTPESIGKISSLKSINQKTCSQCAIFAFYSELVCRSSCSVTRVWIFVISFRANLFSFFWKSLAKIFQKTKIFAIMKIIANFFGQTKIFDSFYLFNFKFLWTFVVFEYEALNWEQKMFGKIKIFAHISYKVNVLPKSFWKTKKFIFSRKIYIFTKY